ncbi:hypothetical protein [Streptomyces flavidovirens]|uniref:hypothetical protein n=1 Tax=Streptomyces flavidovirens TaxID=67298 RepID=UPI0036820F1E
MTNPPTDAPVLPVLPRSALLLWFAVQWIAIPLEVLARIAVMAVKVAGDATSADGTDPRRAVARATSLRSLRFQMSRDPAKRKAHLEQKVAVLAEELRTQRFTLTTSLFHAPRWKASPGNKGLTLRPRDYRGIPKNTIEQIVASHGLRLAGDGSIGKSLRIFEGQLWEEVA